MIRGWNIKEHILLLRPHHYIKNLFIFMPLFFLAKVTYITLLLKTFIVFVAFSLIASSVYIFNDFFDIKADKNHPVKKYRPLTSGMVSKKNALILMSTSFCLGITIAATQKISVVYLLVLYVVLNYLYTIKLKQIIAVDVIVVAIGFVIRLLVGSITIDIKISVWTIFLIFLFALFLAISKRRDDVLLYMRTGLKLRKIVGGYSMKVLDLSMIIIAPMIVIGYTLYTVSPQVVKQVGSDKLYLTTIFVFTGVLRYMQMFFVKKFVGSPIEMLLQDRIMQLIVSGWILTLSILLYT